MADRIEHLFHGPMIGIQYRAGLHDTAGNPAHASTFIRQRLIVLDTELKKNPGEYRRVLLHEFFHFVWIRLGNPRRWAWERHLETEWNARARGEAGWSAEWRKQKLSASDVINRTVFWREYCCESFCDTAACIYSQRQSEETTLARRRVAARAAWFQRTLPDPPFPI